MLSLNTFLSTAISFVELAPVVRQIRENISFFGWRYLYVPTYEGELHIDALANRVTQLAWDTRGFSEEERTAGYEIADIVNRLYLENDRRRDNLNFFSYTLCKIRDFWNTYLAYGGRLGDRDMWALHNQPTSVLFGWYTREQYAARFRHFPLAHENSIRIDSSTILWGPFAREPVLID